MKTADPWLRFIFITGVTKFAQMGIFCNLNQLADISLMRPYATLCGLTLAEIEENFAPEIDQLVEYYGGTPKEMVGELARRYDGYHFSGGNVPDVFNPFSLLSVMAFMDFQNYWFATGTPTFLARMLQQTDFDLRELDGIEITASSLTDDRIYLIPYSADSRKTVKVGVEFNAEERNIGKWTC